MQTLEGLYVEEQALFDVSISIVAIILFLNSLSLVAWIAPLGESIRCAVQVASTICSLLCGGIVANVYTYATKMREEGLALLRRAGDDGALLRRSRDDGALLRCTGYKT